MSSIIFQRGELLEVGTQVQGQPPLTTPKAIIGTSYKFHIEIEFGMQSSFSMLLLLEG